MTQAPGPAAHKSFLHLLLAEMFVRMGLLLLVMVLVAGGVQLAGLGGALAGLGVGLVAYVLVIRRFNARPTH